MGRGFPFLLSSLLVFRVGVRAHAVSLISIPHHVSGLRVCFVHSLAFLPFALCFPTLSRFLRLT